MNKYYECHITMIGKPEFIKPLVEKTKWKFSSIDGDPVLGDGIKCYATRLFNYKLPQDQVLDILFHTANNLKDKDCNVVRRKIELVIYDDKSSHVKFDCKGGCKDCHLDDIEPKVGI